MPKDLAEGLRSAAPTRESIRALVPLAKETKDLPALVRRTRDEAGADAAAALLLAGWQAGRKFGIDLVAELLPLLSDGVVFSLLCGVATGDRADALLRLVDEERLPSRFVPLALLVAADLGDDAAPDPRLLGQLRIAGYDADRKDDAYALLVALAARRFKDPAVKEAARTSLTMLKGDDPVALEAPHLAPFRQPSLDLLPARVSRTGPEPGRNDPCPCGSGLKYKKCHAGRPGDLGPSPASTPDPRDLAAEDVKELSWDALRRLPFAKLKSAARTEAFRRLVDARLFDDAERAAAAFKPETRDGGLVEIALAAFHVGEHDRVRRLVDETAGRVDLRPGEDLRFRLAADGADRFRVLGDAALEALANEKADDPKAVAPVDVAFALLDLEPALGVLLARAAVDPRHAKDSEWLLDDVERARDRLALPPWDRAQKLYARQEKEVQKSRDTDRAVRGLNTDLVRRTADLEERLRESADKLVTLERALRLKERREEEEASRPDAAANGEAFDAEERRRLQQKVAELKALVDEGKDERAELRRKLADADRDLAEARGRAAPAPAPAAEDTEPGTATEGPPAGRAMLPAGWHPTAEAALEKMPAPVARRTMLLATELAAGEPSAWNGVKRLEAPSAPVLSARAGIHHRILFRVSGERLEVLRVVHRKDLESTIRALG